jgi:hypothetical protein
LRPFDLNWCDFIFDLFTKSLRLIFVALHFTLMEPLRELGKTLLFLAGVLAFVGGFFYFGGKLPFRLGRLPGDIVHEGEHSTFYFPLTTGILLSAGLSLLLWLIFRLRR